MLRNLRLLRDEKGISQQVLADAIGLSQPSVNKYENHNIEPDIETLRRLADYFDTSVDFIIGHTDVRRKIEKTSPHNLNESEAALIRDFRALSPAQKSCILTTVRTFLNK